MGKKAKKLSKKIDKLEKKADGLRKKVEKKAGDLQHKAADRIDELQGKDKKSRKGIVALLLGTAAAAGVVLKRKRDQELDEALWEEPRSI